MAKDQIKSFVIGIVLGWVSISFLDSVREKSFATATSPLGFLVPGLSTSTSKPAPTKPKPKPKPAATTTTTTPPATTTTGTGPSPLGTLVPGLANTTTGKAIKPKAPRITATPGPGTDVTPATPGAQRPGAPISLRLLPVLIQGGLQPTPPLAPPGQNFPLPPGTKVKTGHEAMENKIPLPLPQTPIHGTSQHVTILESNPKQARPNELILYAMANNHKGNSAELNLMYGTNNQPVGPLHLNNFVAIFSGNNLKALNVPIKNGHTYERKILYNDNANTVTYSVTDLTDPLRAHDQFTFNRKLDIAPIFFPGRVDQSSLDNFVEFHNTTLGTITPPSQTGAFPGPYTIRVDNMRLQDGNKDTAINEDPVPVPARRTFERVVRPHGLEVYP